MAEDYGKTLNLPSTEFSMRANLPQREPEILKKWQDENMYEKLMENNEGKPLFILEENTPSSSSSALGLSFSSRISTSSSSSPNYVINSKLVNMSVGVRSLFLVSQYMLLSDDEAQAISYASDTELLEGKMSPYTLLLSTALEMQKTIYENPDVVSGYSFTVIQPK